MSFQPEKRETNATRATRGARHAAPPCIPQAEPGERPGKRQRCGSRRESVGIAVGSCHHTYLVRATALALGRSHAVLLPRFHPAKYNPAPEKALLQTCTLSNLVYLQVRTLQSLNYFKTGWKKFVGPHLAIRRGGKRSPNKKSNKDSPHCSTTKGIYRRKGFTLEIEARERSDTSNVLIHRRLPLSPRLNDAHHHRRHGLMRNSTSSTQIAMKLK